MSFKLVIFDLDGTLVDSSLDVIDCFKYAFEQEGLQVPPEDEIKSTIGYPLDEVLGKYGDAERMHAAFLKKAKEIMGNKTILLPGARETLAKIRDKNIDIAIATTKIRQNTRRIVRLLGIENYIGELSGADDVDNVKPAPDALLRLLNICKVDKDEAIMVGDTINDIIAARNAGVKCAAILGGFDPVEIVEESGADWIFDDIRKVVEVVCNE